jgi:hypothetical protein
MSEVDEDMLVCFESLMACLWHRQLKYGVTPYLVFNTALSSHAFPSLYYTSILHIAVY